jgi:MFS superfamily sulfate permease-like transporter
MIDPPEELTIPPIVLQPPARRWSSFISTHWISNYEAKFIVDDIVAGVSLAVLVIPQAISYALLAKVESVNGLYTTVISSSLYLLLGSHEFTNIGMFAIVNLITGQAVTTIQNSIELHIDVMHIAVWITFVTGVFQFLFWILKLPKKLDYLFPGIF